MLNADISRLYLKILDYFILDFPIKDNSKI